MPSHTKLRQRERTRAYAAPVGGGEGEIGLPPHDASCAHTRRGRLHSHHLHEPCRVLQPNIALVSRYVFPPRSIATTVATWLVDAGNNFVAARERTIGHLPHPIELRTLAMVSDTVVQGAGLWRTGRGDRETRYLLAPRTRRNRVHPTANGHMACE